MVIKNEDMGGEEVEVGGEAGTAAAEREWQKRWARVSAPRLSLSCSRGVCLGRCVNLAAWTQLSSWGSKREPNKLCRTSTLFL